MSGRKLSLVSLFAVLCLCLTAFGVSAQETLGALTVGQPVSADVSAESPTARYSYTLAQASAVSFQAIGETTQPTLAIVQDGTVVASEPNTAGGFIVSLNTFLSAGTYTVEVGAANATTGSVFLVIQSETPVTVAELPAATLVNGEVSSETPVTLYHFTGLIADTFVEVNSAQLASGVNVRLTNETTQTQSGSFGADLLGGRFHIPAGTSSYLLEVEHSGAASAEAFTVCWYAATAPGCGETESPVIEATPIPTLVSATTCTVTGNGSVNIRASASTSAPILASLPGGSTANVLGIAPDGSFYNVLYANVNGWVAASVVTASGSCTGLPVVNPPSFVPVATAVPTLPPQPTQPVQPTLPPAPTQAQQPTQVPTPAGPCLLTVNSAVNVYVVPTGDISDLFDQVQSGELIPVGRLADNSWWKTNYGGAWISTGTFGGAVTVSGNCALPTVTP